MSTPTPDLPDPEWWAKAREMKGRGLRVSVIARLVKKDRQTVRYALDPEYRERRKAWANAYNRAHPRRVCVRDKSRELAREEARAQWRAAGRVRSLHDIYREFNCS